MAYTTIDDPSAYFHTQLYTGNGTAIGSGGNAITNNANSGDFKPDWTWHKVRSTTNDHQVYDSSRGVKIRLNPNATNSDFTLNEGLQSFDTNGFTVGSDNGVNQSSQTFVAWQWKANGGTTSSNTDGTITSTVQANTTAGFSIVTYTGNGTNGAYVGHGLGATPDIVIIKNRSAAKDWRVGFRAFSNDLVLNDTSAGAAYSDGRIGDLLSDKFELGGTSTYGSTNTSGENYVAYVFKSIQGYSKFGSYTGNANADGPFIYTGFKPAWVMTKKVSATGSWWLIDNAREPYNPAGTKFILVNSSNAEVTSPNKPMDLLSNGFKPRDVTGYHNDADTYIYLAFAEHPFVGSDGVPTTAR
jgi:hypothetical protein